MQKLLVFDTRQLSPHCTGQSALKKINCCKSRGARAQCPIAGDANDGYIRKEMGQTE